MTMPAPSPPKSSNSARIAAISAAGLLIGFGLCGIDSRLHSELGPLSGWGAFICVVSAVVLFVSLLALGIEHIRDYYQ